jgi:flagellar biosynthesis protein FlhA
VLPLAAISVIFVMLVPLPAAALDFLLALSMAASIIVFLSAVQIRRAVELSVFPTLLLLLTLFRLALNIASSRRILLHGSEGTAAAGKVIEAFGQFVVGGNYVVGFVLFLALIAIQFWWSRTERCAPPRSRPASPSTRCRASRWPSTRT